MMARLILSILPTNQARNPVLGGGSEMEHIAPLAAAVYQEASQHPAITAMLFTGRPDTQDSPPGSLSGLIAQQKQAAGWIYRTRQEGDLTVSLNLHSDSGSESHCGFYFDSLSGPVSAWLGKALTDAIRHWFGGKVYSADYGTVPVGDGQFGYLFARLLRDVACPILLEMGSHQVAADVAAVRDHAPELATAIVLTMLGFFGLETEPPINVGELRTFPTWALARLERGQTSLDTAAFREHLAAIGADPSSPLVRYGIPTE